MSIRVIPKRCHFGSSLDVNDPLNCKSKARFITKSMVENYLGQTLYYWCNKHKNQITNYENIVKTVRIHR